MLYNSYNSKGRKQNIQFKIYLSIAYGKYVMDCSKILKFSINSSNIHDRYQNQNYLLVTRQNDNHSPGPGPGRLIPSSHQRSGLSNNILGTFSRGDKRVWKCIPIPNAMGGGGATLVNIGISNWDLICHRMTIPAAPNQGG